MTTTKTPQPLEPDYGDDDEPAEAEPATLDDLLGAPPPTCTFPEIGTTYTGVILDMGRSVQRDLKGEVRTFDDGTPRPQAVLTLGTDLRDDDDDDGLRRLFVKGAMTKAFREASKALRPRGPRVGDTVTVTYTGDGEAA